MEIAQARVASSMKHRFDQEDSTTSKVAASHSGSPQHNFNEGFPQTWAWQHGQRYLTRFERKESPTW